MMAIAIGNWLIGATENDAQKNWENGCFQWYEVPFAFPDVATINEKDLQASFIHELSRYKNAKWCTPDWKVKCLWQTLDRYRVTLHSLYWSTQWLLTIQIINSFLDRPENLDYVMRHVDSIHPVISKIYNHTIRSFTITQFVRWILGFRHIS